MHELRDCCSFDSVIGIATHRSGVAFLRNLLASLRDYSAYPIVVVINDFRNDDGQLFGDVLREFPQLPIYVATLPENLAEFGVLAALDRVHRCDNIFLLSHSCEIKDPTLFDLVLRDLPYETSVALSYMPHLGPYRSWTSFLGKYRRDVLREIAFERYAPRNFFESYLAEMCLTHSYSMADPSGVHVLFPDFADSRIFEEKCGKRVMKIENPYLIKWKSHWKLKHAIVESARQSGVEVSQETVLGYFDRIPDGHRYQILRRMLADFFERGQQDGGRLEDAATPA